MAIAAISHVLRNRAAAWAARRQGSDAMPVILERRRVYILPTRQGLLFAAAVFFMLLASLNYNNNLGLLLTFLLAGLAISAMYRCQRNLVGLTVHVYPPEPVFAGEPLHFTLLLRHSGRQQRLAISGAAETVDVPPGRSVTVELAQKTTRRGHQPLQRFALATTFPLGLFRAWVWINADVAGLAWPRPADEAAPNVARPGGDAGTGSGTVDGDDFAGLRDWRTGDSIQHIDWRALARGRGLLTKQFASAPPAVRDYDLATLAALPLETAIAQLARSVLDADAAGEACTLRLGKQVFGPDTGRAHRDRCLTALALYGSADG